MFYPGPLMFLQEPFPLILPPKEGNHQEDSPVNWSLLRTPDKMPPETTPVKPPESWFEFCPRPHAQE